MLVVIVAPPHNVVIVMVATIPVKCNSTKPPIDTQHTPKRMDTTSKSLDPKTMLSSTAMTCNVGRGIVLLQTACTVAFNVNEPERRVVVHILLDSGSQCSYITHKTCNRLGLSSLGTKSMSIITFGSRQEKLKDCVVVRIGLETKSGGPS